MNYKKLFTDMKAGRINWKEWRLVYDNNGGYWQYIGREKPADGETRFQMQDRMCKPMDERYGSPDGYQDLVDLARAAGINAEWC